MTQTPPDQVPHCRRTVRFLRTATLACVCARGAVADGPFTPSSAPVPSPRAIACALDMPCGHGCTIARVMFAGAPRLSAPAGRSAPPCRVPKGIDITHSQDASSSLTHAPGSQAAQVVLAMPARCCQRGYAIGSSIYIYCIAAWQGFGFVLRCCRLRGDK